MHQFPKAVAIHALSLKGSIGLTNQACWLGILLTFEILLTWIVDSCNVLMFFLNLTLVINLK
jgi:hypothetical protein